MMKIGHAVLAASALLVVLINAHSTSTQRMSRLATTKRQTAPTKSLPQGVKVDLPRGLNNASRDPAPLGESSIVVSIPNNDQFYVGRDPIPKDQLGRKIGPLMTREGAANRIVYIASGASVEYRSVVEALNIIREQEIDQIGLMVDRGNRDDAVPGQFLIEVPMPRKADDGVRFLKPNPLTLVVAISRDLKLALNNRDRPEKGEPCFGLVPEYGSVNEPDHLAQCLERVFTRRFKEHAYRPGMETRNDVRESQRIERTVFVKAPRSIRYGDVVRVIDLVKGSGADPIGLQIDDLPQ
jgi:biopolymer transport protein ExbD